MANFHQVANKSARDLSCDDFYFSLLVDEIQNDENFTISDDKYAEELQNQEVIMTSTIFNQNSTNSPAPTIFIQNSTNSPASSCVIANERAIGESSLSFCEICAERKGTDEMFTIETCTHVYCTDCICKHVETKIQDNVQVVTCPGVACNAILDFETCSSIIPKDVRNRWDEILCESLILGSQKFYCPYKDCSAMLVNDSDEIVRESECPECHRLFCAQCYVPWHCGVECEEFQRLNADERGREDLMVRELAKAKQWGRCPHCKFFVEKTEGCLHMTCKCGSQFCYRCGVTWGAAHSC
ncbi:E3 ubiquitin-protein ligase RSL1-like [Lycium ferocissimum]|uniref:E3 ubiquitin-protein ligase RSL1-like n=1 Tax=Lycium ferocissimum TaxID=112874 RepID=UPI0028156660|nr:E3 ubiquitin-protein ligase RSL1-like [Lycium ferocissimum]